MKTTLKMLMALGVAVLLLNGCGGGNGGDDTPPAPVEVVENDITTCTGKQVYADANGVQVDVTCTNPANIDLDGGTGNPAPYIQINELQVSLPADKVVSNDGATIVWHRIVYPLPSGLSASGVVVVYASNEAGDFEKVESVPFAVQTAQAPVKPTPTPTPDPDPISTPTISMGNKTVNDDGGGFDNPVGTPTVTGVETNAVYSLSPNPFGAMLTINSSTGAMTWHGDLFSDTTNDVGVKVTNTDGGTATATFSLTVIDNL